MENPISVPIKTLLLWLLLANLVTLVFMEKYLLGRTAWLASLICFHFALMVHVLLWDLLFHPCTPSTVRPSRLVSLCCSVDSQCPCCLLWQGGALPGSGLGGLGFGGVPALPHRVLKQRSVCFVAVRLDLVGVWGISQLTRTIIRNLSAAEGLKEASLINAITQMCLSHVSYLIPAQEKRHSSGHCFCLSERDTQVPQASSESRVALLCTGWQLVLGFGFL